MIHEYIFMPPQTVLSGVGALESLPAQIERLGKSRAFVLTGNTLATKTDLVKKVEATLGERHAGTFAGCKQHVLASCVDEATEQARLAEADVLIAFGGGSPIDATKHVAHRLLGDAPRETMPQVAIPTTLSAGEFTAGAGITNETTRVKSGVRSTRILPSVVIHDAALSVETPDWLWASTGMKAMDHAIEALWSPRAHPVTSTLAVEAIRRLRLNLKPSLDPANLDARTECLNAAWMSIFGVRNVGMRLSHPLGHQIGARWDVPHGVTSCVILPAVMRHFAPTTAPAQRRIAEAFGCDIEGKSDEAVARSAHDALTDFIASLPVPQRLSETSAKRDELSAVAKAVAEELHSARSPDAGTVTEDLLLELLEGAW